MQLRILSAADVTRALPIEAALEAARRAFLAQSAGEVAAPQRTALPVEPRGGVTLVMPAHLPGVALTTKVVSVFPTAGGPDAGPAIRGALLVLDERDGAPRALLDAPTVTALRTGAAVGLATDLLAAREARVAAILGCGVQGRSALRALACVRPLERVRLWSRHRARAERLAAELSRTEPYSVEVVDDPSAAARGAHVVCTATPATAPLLSDADLDRGAHLNALGSFRHGMLEFEPELLRDARVVVDAREAALAEAGELAVARVRGWTRPEDWTELGELLAGAPSAHDPGARTVFKSVGLAVQDVTAAAAVLAQAEALGLGTLVDA